MKLRSRILTALAATFIAAAFSTWMLSGKPMLQGFADLEDSRAQEDTQRVSRAIGFTGAEFHNKSLDWAHWDDTFQFLKDHNQTYLDSNMDPVSFRKIGLHFLLLIDSKTNLVHSTTSLSDSDPEPFTPQQVLSKMIELKQFDKTESGHSDRYGFMVVNDVPVLISLRDVHHTSGIGESNGWICFVRLVDEDFVQELRKVTRQTASLTLITQPDSIPKWYQADAARNLVGISHLDSNRTQGAAVIKDLTGAQRLLLTVDMPRNEFRFGNSVIAANMWHFALIGLLFAIVIVFIIERSVLTRLRRLEDQVDQVDPTKGGSFGHRVNVEGTDELASLAFKINSMLLALDDHSSRLKESEEKLKAHNEKLEATVVERTREIEYQAHHDKLTGLPNRALFMGQLDQALKTSGNSHRGTAVLFIDLDNFKLINDSLGHDVGDQFLVSIADRIKRDVREQDTVARLGGDEFTVVMTNLTSVDQAVDVAERILQNLRDPVRLMGRDAYSGASIGISYSESNTVNSQMMLKNADTAMYRAKADGKMGIQVFDESMRDAVLERLEMETALRKALLKNEVWVAFQPIVSLENEKLVGAEALARWNNSVYGQVSPSEFISIAEETGEIVAIGYWVLERACRQAKAWIESTGLTNFTMSVNLSGKQLQRQDVVARVAEILEVTGLPAANLMLEITESILMEDKTDIIAKMNELKALGLRLALDDFGTGYSSLSTLRLFPIDNLKVDRSFICRIDKEEGAMAIVEAITAMAKSMKMSVTGEGVESLVQKDLICRLGCANGQGYYFDRPLSPDEFRQRLIDAQMAAA